MSSCVVVSSLQFTDFALVVLLWCVRCCFSIVVCFEILVLCSVGVVSCLLFACVGMCCIVLVCAVVVVA